MARDLAPAATRPAAWEDVENGAWTGLPQREVGGRASLSRLGTWLELANASAAGPQMLAKARHESTVVLALTVPMRASRLWWRS